MRAISYERTISHQCLEFARRPAPHDYVLTEVSGALPRIPVMGSVLFGTGTSYAARFGSAFLINLAISPGAAPIASNERTIKSSDTERSPASILATRDWLECNR